MKINRILIFVVTAAMFLTPIVNAVSNPISVSIDVSTGIVDISGVTTSGQAGKTVTLIVTNPDKDIVNIPDDSLVIQKQGETVSSVGGAFNFVFKIYLDENARAGSYKVYIGGDDFETPLSTSFYYATKLEREAAISQINDAQDAVTMQQLITQHTETLFLHSIPFDAIDYTGLAVKLLAQVRETPFDINNESSLQSWITQQSVVEAYNQSISNVIYGADNTFQYANIVGFNQLDLDVRNLTVYETYQNLLSEDGKLAVRQNLLGKNYNEIKDLQNIFIQQVVLKGIKSVKKDGYGHINGLLINNGTAAGLDMTKYKLLRSTGDIDSALVSQSFETIPQLNAIINNLIDIENSSGNPIGGGSTGGGGRGNTSFAVSGDVSLPIITPIPTPTPVKNFVDLSDVQWAQEAVEALAKNGVVSVTEDGIFRPNDPITREEFVKMLVLAMKVDMTEIDAGFNDVSQNDWFAPYLASAKNIGIVSGRTDGSFGVGLPITRQDVAVMTYRAIKNTGVEFLGQDANYDFSDSALISDYAVDGIYYLVKARIINGMSDGTFAPNMECTRAQAAKILYGMIK